MGLTELQGQWIPIQAQVFSRWVSGQLKTNESIDITKDLKTGVYLVELAKILTCKETPRRWNRTPKRNVDMVQNCDLALDKFTKDVSHHTNYQYVHYWILMFLTKFNLIH